MFKKLLALSVLSLCATINAAERESWENPSGKIKIIGIKLKDLNIQRDPKLHKEFLLAPSEISIEQQRNCTKIDFHHGSTDTQYLMSLKPSKRLDEFLRDHTRTIIVGKKTFITHQAYDGTTTKFKAKITHDSDKEKERKRNLEAEAAAHEAVAAAQRESEAAAAAALAQVGQTATNRLKRRVGELNRYKKRHSTELLQDTPAADDLPEEQYPITHSRASIKFSPAKRS